jgi:hypothetical protein
LVTNDTNLEALEVGCNRRCALPHTAQLAYSEA